MSKERQQHDRMTERQQVCWCRPLERVLIDALCRYWRLVKSTTKCGAV